MELVWLVARGSRSMAFGDEFLDVECDLGEHLGDDACAQGGGDECARQDAPQDVEGQCAVDAPGGVGLKVALGGAPRGQRGEVVAHGLGPEVLPGGKPGQAAGVFEVEAMLETFESLLDTPALMVELGEGFGGKACGVEERSHQHAHLALRRDLADQAHARRGARTLVVGRVPRAGRRQGDDRLALPGTHEAAHRPETVVLDVATHAERDVAVDEQRHQPRARIAAIEQQQIARGQRIEVLDKHLAFVAHRLVEGEVLEQFEAGQEQAEGHGFLDVAHAALGIEQREAYVRGVGGDQAQAAPAGEADLFVHEREQRVIDALEDIGANLVTRLGEGLCGDHAQQPGALREQGEKAVELGLHGTAYATEQEREHGGEGQRAAAGEELGREPVGLQKFLRIQEVGQPTYDMGIFRPSWKSLNGTMGYVGIIASESGIGKLHLNLMTKC